MVALDFYWMRLRCDIGHASRLLMLRVETAHRLIMSRSQADEA